MIGFWAHTRSGFIDCPFWWLQHGRLRWSSFARRPKLLLARPSSSWTTWAVCIPRSHRWSGSESQDGDRVKKTGQASWQICPLLLDWFWNCRVWAWSKSPSLPSSRSHSPWSWPLWAAWTSPWYQPVSPEGFKPDTRGWNLSRELGWEEKCLPRGAGVPNVNLFVGQGQDDLWTVLTPVHRDDAMKTEAVIRWQQSVHGLEGVDVVNAQETTLFSNDDLATRNL